MKKIQLYLADKLYLVLYIWNYFAHFIAVWAIIHYISGTTPELKKIVHQHALLTLLLPSTILGLFAVSCNFKVLHKLDLKGQFNSNEFHPESLHREVKTGSDKKL